MKTSRMAMRVNDDEKAYIEKRAAEIGIRPSDFMRTQVLEKMESEQKSYTKVMYDSEIYRMVSTAYFLIGKMSRNTFSDEEIDIIKNKVHSLMVKKGLKEEEA